VPKFAPYSPIQNEIDDRVYKVKSGRFTFYPAFEAREHRDTGRLVTRGIDGFKLTFTPDRRFCHIAFSEDGLERRLTAAMDGTRFWNILHNPNQLAKEVVVNGFWENEKILIFQIRWIETTAEKTIRFRFNSNEIEISTHMSLGTMGACIQPPDSATAE
jgi:hypothetical protein